MNTINNTESTNSDNVAKIESNLPSTETVNSHDNVTTVSSQTRSEIQSVAENNGSQINNVTQDTTANVTPTSAPVTSQTNDCTISIPETFSRTGAGRFAGFIQAKGYVHGLLKPDEFNLRPSTRHTIARSNLGDVTLNLTEFLSYAQRNNYDIVIPASRENGNINARIGPGRGYMVLEQQHFPPNLSETSSYPRPDFIGLNNVPSRNSVLAPNVYHNTEEIQPPVVDFSAPPPYEMPLKLPTYEEVQREKALEGEMLPPNIDSQNGDPTTPRTLSFLAIDADMGTNSDPESKLLGTDFMFGIAFFLALVFNWVGFLLLMCFCHTVAARYGALSGFGLSLAKWTIIVKNSTEVPMHNAWLWWLITAFGLLICIRSLFQYINIKRGWRLMSTATQERLLFFY